MIQTQTADGVVHQFPDDTPPAAIDRAMKDYSTQVSGVNVTAPSPNAPIKSAGGDSWMDAAKDIGGGALSGLEQIPASIGGMVGNIRNAAGTGFSAATQAVGHALHVPQAQLQARMDQVGQTVSHLPIMSGINAMPTSGDLNALRQKVTGPDYQPHTVPGQYAKTIAEFAPAAIAPETMGGKLAGVLAPAIASETAGQATKGTPYEGAARMAGGILGGVGAGALAGKSKGLANVIATPTTNVGLLKSEGVSVLPGQAMGGIAKTMEDIGKRAPILGPAIIGAAERANVRLNQAAANRGVAPLGETVPPNIPAGHKAVEYVANRLGKEYDEAAAMVPQVGLDQQFQQGLAKNAQLISELPTDVGAQYQNILQNRLVPLMGGPVTGQQLRAVQEQIGKIAADRGALDDGAQQLLGHMLENVSDELKDQLARANPQAAAKIQAANEGWRNYVILRSAASKAPKDGIFTPQGLSTAVRMMDRSVGKGNVAKGNATMQDLSSAASSIMPDQFGNPGTANALGLGGLAAGLMNPAMTVQTGAAALGLGGAAIPYAMMGRGAAKNLPKIAQTQQQLQAARRAGALGAPSVSPTVQNALIAAMLSRGP